MAAATLGCALPAAAAAEPRPPDGVLSSRLAELAKPSLRSAPPAEQARELSLAPKGPGSLLRDGNRILVDVRIDGDVAARADDLRAAGAKVVNVSGPYRTVTVAAKPGELEALAAVPGVAGAKELLTPVASAVTPCFGAATSEGDQQLHAAAARKAFEVDGSGVTVGILSDSFNDDEFAATSAAEDVESGDLPGSGNPCGNEAPVNVVEEINHEIEENEGADEGRAMAQIVHDLAPGADLAFASAFNGEIQFAENIERLAHPAPGGAGADVIADDVFYFEEPFFQDGPVAAAASKVSEEGVGYFSAAGNDNLIEEPEPGVENDIASWEAPEFRDAGACPSGVPSYATHCMDFDPQGGPGHVDSGFQITVEPEETLIVDLQWAQPWHGVKTDLDAYLLRGGSRVAEAQEANLGLQEPVEILAWTNSSTSSRTVTLAIDRCDVACGAARAAANPALSGTIGGDSGTPRLKFGLLENGGGVSATEYPKSIPPDVVGPTIFGHAGAARVVGVGAIPYFSESEPEPYSSRGPVKHYFGPVEPGSLTPAPALGSPEVLAKPDLVATDGGANTFFGSCFSHVWRFFGTSAAAPHAAAVAALELSANTSPSASEAIEAQLKTARSLPPFGSNAVGSGLLDAFGALESVTGSSPPEEAVSGPGFAPPDCSAKSGGEAPQLPAPNPPLPSFEPNFRPRPPKTSIRRHPPKLIRTRQRGATAVFRFAANEGDVTFFCRVDGSPLRVCPARFVRRYGVGPHVVRVMARDSEGRIDPTPAVFRFKVEFRD